MFHRVMAYEITKRGLDVVEWESDMKHIHGRVSKAYVCVGGWGRGKPWGIPLLYETLRVYKFQRGLTSRPTCNPSANRTRCACNEDII